MALLAGAALYYFAPGRGQPAPGAAVARYNGPLADGVMSYVKSPEADKACGVCLASADVFLKEKRVAALREKTKDMVYLPAGEYQTGSPEGLGDPDEQPRHKVRLDAFYIEKYEVTTADYMKLVTATGANYPEWAKPGGKFNIDTGSEPYYKRLFGVFRGCPTCPVIGVSVKDAQAYCAAGNRRLPTEAEWEAAARGGSDAAYSFGESPAQAADYAWYDANSGGKPHPVGGRKPNKFGLYDMHGNVWEWVSDLYERDYYYKSPNRDPGGPAGGAENVVRGGSWAFDADSLRSGNRASTYKANDDIGFRCAVSERALLEEIK